MEKITRDNLLGNIDALIEKEKNLTEKKYDYKVNRAWPGLMKISDIETPESLVKAYEVIDKETESHMKAIKALELDKLGLVEDTDKGKTFFGYTRDQWFDDLKLCAEEIADAEKLKKIRTAIKLLKKNMSEEDKFNADMAIVANLIG